MKTENTEGRLRELEEFRDNAIGWVITVLAIGSFLALVSGGWWMGSQDTKHDARMCVITNSEKYEILDCINK